jgi:hypothetical protein
VESRGGGGRGQGRIEGEHARKKAEEKMRWWWPTPVALFLLASLLLHCPSPGQVSQLIWNPKALLDGMIRSNASGLWIMECLLI